jgi:hypothetical protein
MTARRFPALAAVALVAVLVAPRAEGQTDLTADDLGTADALGFATPVGTLLRIPNELPGGALLSKSTLTLDKTQAIAAGYTPGELGEAFLQTTLVAPPDLDAPPEVRALIAWKNPTLITAQTPSSPVFPADVSIAEGGVDADPIEVASIRATTTDRSADADAVGGLRIEADDLQIGTGGSHASTRLLDDGTVVAEAHSFIEDISLAGGLLRLGGIDSTARVELRPGAAPVQELNIEVLGATLAGVPVTINQDGIHIADTALLGLGELGVVNDALGALADQGFSVRLFPGVVREADERSVRVAGAALSIRGDLTDYVPTALDTPIGPVGSPLGDVGTDNEILLGQVEASAYAAERGPLPDFGTPPPPAAIAPAPLSLPSTGAALSLDVPEPPAEVAAPPVADRGELELVLRQDDPTAVALRSGYRWVLVCALVGAIAHLARRRARLI